MPSDKMTISAQDVGVLKVDAPVKSKVRGKKEIFCAPCQAKIEHTLELDKNQEVIATCGCGAFLKFPLGDDPAEFQAQLAAHHEANTGQVTVEMADEAQKAHDARFKKMLGIG